LASLLGDWGLNLIELTTSQSSLSGSAVKESFENFCSSPRLGAWLRGLAKNNRSSTGRTRKSADPNAAAATRAACCRPSAHPPRARSRPARPECLVFWLLMVAVSTAVLKKKHARAWRVAPVRFAGRRWLSMIECGMREVATGAKSMLPENFDNTLNLFMGRKPFQPFTVALVNGDRLEVDHPKSLAWRDGVAIYIAPGGIPTIFDHEGVNQFIGDLMGQTDNQ
jgi:hypothetical protein